MTLRSALHKTAASKGLSLAIIGTAAIGGIGVASSTVFASLNATAYNTTATAITTDTLKLTLASNGTSGITGGFTTAINSVAPGDVVNRFIELTNTGSMTGTALKLSLADQATTALTTNGTAGLQVSVFECASQWSSTGLCNTLPGTVVMVSTPALTLLTVPTSVTVASLAPAATTHLRVQISLPAGGETTTNGNLPAGTVQGLTSQLTWTFNEAQRLTTTTQG